MTIREKEKGLKANALIWGYALRLFLPPICEVIYGIQKGMFDPVNSMLHATIGLGVVRYILIRLSCEAAGKITFLELKPRLFIEFTGNFRSSVDYLRKTQNSQGMPEVCLRRGIFSLWVSLLRQLI